MSDSSGTNEWLTLKRTDGLCVDGSGSEGALLIVIPKKVVATAVGRNRIRRLIKEVFRMDGLRVPAVRYTVRVARKPAASLKLEEVRRSIRRQMV